jgi:hypothetical protein
MCVIAAQLVPPVRAAEVGKLAGARGVAGGAPRSPEAWPGLDDKVRAHRASLGGTWEELRRVAISVDARAVASVAFAVEEGGCTDALLVPDEDVAMVEGDVLDGEGRIVGRAKEGADGRTVTVCSPIAMTGSIQIRPHVGRGLVAVVLSRAKGEATRSAQAKAEVAWVAPQQSLDVTRAARNALLQRAGYAAPSSTLSGQLALGRRVTLPIDLRGGACSRLDVVAGAPLALLEASVWTDGGALLASGDGTDGATLFACGGGKARLDLGTRGRPGPYSVLVRAEPWKDPALTAHPLAGGRMLAHAASGPNALLEGTASSIRHVLLDAAHQHVQNAAVPPGQCLRVAVGAEGAGTGLEARLVDAVDGDELDRSAGQHGVAVRACAGGETRSVRFELRASAGKLETVIGERLAPAR